MRIVSANLWNGKVDPAWLCDLVVALHADAVAIQEAEPRHYEALREVLPHGGFHEGRRATGMGFVARHPVELRWLPLSWRPAPWLRLSPEDWSELFGAGPSGESEPLDLLGVHIAAPHTYNPPGYGFWLRRKQVIELEAHFEAGGGAEAARTLMIGDFNATELWPAYRRLSRQVTDAALVAAQRLGRPTEPTWGLLRRGRRMLRIDHAFTRGVEAADVHVVPLAGSDHSALVVDLRV